MNFLTIIQLNIGRNVLWSIFRCGHLFCFSCSEGWHDPVRCHLIKKWIKKCDDDSETSNWISANTKECPKCGKCTISINLEWTFLELYRGLGLSLNTNRLFFHFQEPQQKKMVVATTWSVKTNLVNQISVGSVWAPGNHTDHHGRLTQK